MSERLASYLSTALGDRPFRYYPVTGSTNDDLREWLRQQPDLPSGTVVIAEGQRQGRGRFRRPWANAPGSSLAITVLLRTDDPRRIPMAAGLAVRDAIREILGGSDHSIAGAQRLAAAPPISLKWPNDVLIGERKVCGILVESAKALRNAYLLGIGINISGEFQGSELGSQATAVGMYTPSDVDVPRLASDVVTGVERWLEAGNLFPAWREALSTLGREVTVQAPDKVIEGRASDVDEEGRLIVRTEGGREERFSAGDVSVHGR